MADGVLAGTKPVPLRCMPMNCFGSSACARRMADSKRFNVDGGLQGRGPEGGSR
jgi:sulfite reductase beta subunit-like hemoprotein